ncbi:MAG TPA: MarR family transcriptional regulator [Steroidobacteraceae bacterium]|nr:MarR family transcriptional regulator [Steroidobacteraceae bacterium]
MKRAGPHSLSKEGYETLAEFRYLLRHFGAFSEEAARAGGLTAQQHQALLAIKGFPGRQEITVGELAERLNSKHHSVVGLVDRLMSHDLIVRRHDEEDRRRVLISLTPKAEKLLLGLSLAHREELRRLAPLLQELLRRVTAV